MGGARSPGDNTYQTGVGGWHASMRSEPVGHNIALKTEFVFQQTIERLAVLAAVAFVGALVGAHD